MRKSNLFVEMEDKGYDSEPRRMAAEYIHTIQHPFSIVPESVLSFHDPTANHRGSNYDAEKTVRHSPRSVTRRLNVLSDISSSTTAYSVDAKDLKDSSNENQRRQFVRRERIPVVYREVDSSLSEENVTGINVSVPNVPNKLNSAKTPESVSQANYRGYYEAETSRKPVNATAQQNYRIIQRRKPVDIQLDTAPSVSSADPRSNWNLSPHKERDPLVAVSQVETYDLFPRPFKPTVYNTAIQDRSDDSSLPTTNHKSGEIPLIPMQLPEEPDEIIIVIKSKSGDTEGKKDNVESLTSADSTVQQWNSSPYSKHPTLPLESRVLKALQEHVTSETNPLSSSVSNIEATGANKQSNIRYPNNRGLHSARYRATSSTFNYKTTTVATPKETEPAVPSENEKITLSANDMSPTNNETKLKLVNVEGTKASDISNDTKNETTPTDSTFADQFSISNFWAPIKKLVENNIPIVKYVPRRDYSQVNERIEDNVQSQTNISATLPKVTKLTRVKASLLNFKQENNISANNLSHNARQVQGDAVVGLNRENRDTVSNTSVKMYNENQTQDKVSHIKGEENNSEERVSFGDRIITGKQGKYDKVINRRPVLKSTVSDDGYETDGELNSFVQIPLQSRSDHVELRDRLAQGREKRYSGNPKYLDSQEEDKRVEGEIEEIDASKEKQVFEEGKEWKEAIRLVESSTPKQQLNREKYPFYKKQPVNSLSIHSPLRYALNPSIVPRKTDGGMEFYESRESIQCPEVSPNLSDVVPKRKSPGQWNKEPRPRNLPRLSGLGDKLDCLKVKYWGEEPLDNPFFTEDTVEGVEKSKSGRFERVASDETMDFFADVADAVENIKNLGRGEIKSWPAEDLDPRSSKQMLQDETVKEEQSKILASLGGVPNSKVTNEPTKSNSQDTHITINENCKSDMLNHAHNSQNGQSGTNCHSYTTVPKSQLSSAMPPNAISSINIPLTKFESVNEPIIGLYPPPITLNSNIHTRVQDNIKSNNTISSISSQSHIANDTTLSDYMEAEETVPIPVTISEDPGDTSEVSKNAAEESLAPNQGSRILQYYMENLPYENLLNEQNRNRNLNNYIELLSTIQRSRNIEKRPDSDHNSSDRSYNRVWSRGSAVNKDERSREHSKSATDQRRGEPRYSDEGEYERNILHSRKNPESKREHRRRNKIDYSSGEAAMSTAEREDSVSSSEMNPPFENYPATYNMGIPNRKNPASENRTKNKPTDNKSFRGIADRSSRYSDNTQGRSQHSVQERVDNSLSGTKPKSDIERFKDLGLWLSPEQINEVLGAFINKHKVLLTSPPALQDSTPSPAGAHLRSKSRSQSAVPEIRDSTTTSLPKQSEQYSTELPTTSAAPNTRQSTLRYSDQLEVSTILPDYYRKRKPQPRTTTIRTVTESIIDPPKKTINSQERRQPSRTNAGNRNRARNNEFHSTRTSPRTSVNPQQEEQNGSWKSNRTNSTAPFQTTSLRKQNSRSNNTGVRQQSRDNSRSAWQQRTSRTSTEATPTTTESPRRVKAVEHRRVTKQEIFTRTYIPHGDSEDEQGEESERYEELEPRLEYTTEEDIYEPYESYQQQNGYLSSRGNYLTTQKSLLDSEEVEENKSENYPNFPFNTKEGRKSSNDGNFKMKPKNVSGSSTTTYECPGASEVTQTDPYYSSEIESRSKKVNGDLQKRNRFHNNEFSGVSGTSHLPVTTDGSKNINLGIRDGKFESVRNVDREKYDYLPRIKSDRRELERTTQKSYNLNLNRQSSPYPRYDFKRVVDKAIENRKPLTEYEDVHKKHLLEHVTEKAELDQNKKLEGKDEEDPNTSYRKYSNKQHPALSYPEDPSDADSIMYSVDPRTGLGKWSPEPPKRVYKVQNRSPDLDDHLPTDSPKHSDYRASSQDTDRRRVSEDSSSNWSPFPRRNRYHKKLNDQGGKVYDSNDDGKPESNANENSSTAPNRERAKLSGRHSGKKDPYSMKEVADSLYKDYETQLYQNRGAAPVTERGRKDPGELQTDGGAEASDLTLEHQVYILGKILSSLPPRQRAGVVRDLAESMQRAVLPAQAVADPGQRMYYYVLPEDGGRSQEETQTLGRRSQKS